MSTQEESQEYIHPLDANKTKPKIVYEWVLTYSKGDDIFLTENQFAVYKQHLVDGDKSQLIFSDVVVNPAYVLNAIKRVATVIKDKYFCRLCHGAGMNQERTRWCERCRGSRVDLPKHL